MLRTGVRSRCCEPPDVLLCQPLTVCCVVQLILFEKCFMWAPALKPGTMSHSLLFMPHSNYCEAEHKAGDQWRLVGGLIHSLTCSQKVWGHVLQTQAHLGVVGRQFHNLHSREHGTSGKISARESGKTGLDSSLPSNLLI
jgi:hypothetical protein